MAGEKLLDGRGTGGDGRTGVNGAQQFHKFVRRARWETERTIRDPEEHEKAIAARSLARSALQTVCAKSAFGLMCPEANMDKLQSAIRKARDIADQFNSQATLTRLNVYVMVGKVAADDVEAVRAINSEIRDLMDTMSAGLAQLDVKVVREAAQKAKSVMQMLDDQNAERVQGAIDLARKAARAIKKAGEEGAPEIDKVTIQRISEARTSFLDLDTDGEVRLPDAPVRVVDMEEDDAEEQYRRNLEKIEEKRQREQPDKVAAPQVAGRVLDF